MGTWGKRTGPVVEREIFLKQEEQEKEKGEGSVDRHSYTVTEREHLLRKENLCYRAGEGVIMYIYI